MSQSESRRRIVGVEAISSGRENQMVLLHRRLPEITIAAMKGLANSLQGTHWSSHRIQGWTTQGSLVLTFSHQPLVNNSSVGKLCV